MSRQARRDGLPVETMLEELKQRVCEANRRMSAGGLAFGCWGSVSGIDRQAGVVVITPAGGAAAAAEPDHLAAVRLDGGSANAGDRKSVV